MKKRKWIYLILVIVVIIIVAFIKDIAVYNKNNNDDNEYYDLSQITNVNLDDLYIKGRNDKYNKALNYLYGDKSKAAKIPLGSVANQLLVFYDENGNEKLGITFIFKGNLVVIDNEQYLYNENTVANYSTKELYPDKNKSDCEKMLYDIVKLYENDDYYMWDYYNKYRWEYASLENINGVYFSNEGINVTILEYKDNTIENDYIKVCDRKKSSYAGNLVDAFTSETKKINTYIGAREDYKYTIIKYDKFIIDIEYSYDYRYQNSVEVNKNIEIFNKYLKELNIL